MSNERIEKYIDELIGASDGSKAADEKRNILAKRIAAFRKECEEDPDSTLGAQFLLGLSKEMDTEQEAPESTANLLGESFPTMAPPMLTGAFSSVAQKDVDEHDPSMVKRSWTRAVDLTDAEWPSVIDDQAAKDDGGVLILRFRWSSEENDLLVVTFEGSEGPVLTGEQTIQTKLVNSKTNAEIVGDVGATGLSFGVPDDALHDYVFHCDITEPEAYRVVFSTPILK